jgi:glyoxylase-like metal-dependent hydrolase (beta-lactamase superfamily II)
VVTAAGFEDFEITWKKDVFSGAAQEGSAASFGTLGINFRAQKPADDQGGTETTTASEHVASSHPVEGDGFPAPATTIGADTLRDMLDRGEPVTVLDIRQEKQRTEWAIPSSIHVDAYEALNSGKSDALVGVALPDDRPVVTVCAAGKISAIAAEQLRAQGYDALSLAGGMKAWSLAWNSAEVPVDGTEARVIQVRRTGKGCLSYLVGSDSEAAVIDAALEPEVYLYLAHSYGWKITHVLDTHLHADHLSRSRKLAELSGATLHQPEGTPVSYRYSPLQDGDVLQIGAARLKALHTAGHTTESTSYLLDERALFTGDTLFLAGVGRPDLEASPQEARVKAYKLCHTLGRLLALRPETLILPGHTNEPVPFDGEPLCATLGEVHGRAGLLQEDEETFVEKLMVHLSSPPPNHMRIVKLNKAGVLPEEDPAELEAGANRCAAG